MASGVRGAVGAATVIDLTPGTLGLSGPIRTKGRLEKDNSTTAVPRHGNPEYAPASDLAATFKSWNTPHGVARQ